MLGHGAASGARAAIARYDGAAPQPSGMAGAYAPPSRWQERYAAPGWQQRLTRLPPGQEAQFQAWARANRVPLTEDYDMRGFWLNEGRAPDSRGHYPDTYKTPLHDSFSGESIYADPRSGAPRWNDRNQLVLPDGTVLFDERRRR